MSSSPNPYQSYFEAYEPKSEPESPFLNEEFLADEARIAQWRVPAPSVQLESPFLQAFEEEWRSDEFEEFLDETDEEEFEEEEAISDYHNPEVEAYEPKTSKKKGSIMPPDPQPHDYADVVREILRKRKKRSLGIVLSVVELSSADGKEIIDTQTERVKFRRRLKHPPAHVVLPADVFEIEWKKIKLQYVWILSNWKSTFPVGGVLFLPSKGSVTLYLVTFNVGALDDGCTNIHHAEMQAVQWIEEQQAGWVSRVGDINIWNLSTKSGLGYSPCNYCCEDLVKFLTNLRLLQNNRRASITWLTLYDKNKACGHPTNTANLMKMQASGWECNNSPGCPQGKPLPTNIPRNQVLGYPTKIASLSKEVDDEEFGEAIELEEETTGKPENEFKNCSNAQKSEIQEASKRAIKSVRYAETLIGSAYGRPDKMSEITRKLLDKHFHTIDRDDLREILSKLISIRRTFEKGISFECEKQCEITVRGRVLGHANNRQWFGGWGNVHICFDNRSGGGDFLKESLKSQEALVIHEVGHRYAGLDDEAYLHEKRYAMLSPKQAINNADSYAGFSVDLYRFGTGLSKELLDDEFNYIEDVEEYMEELEDEESNWQTGETGEIELQAPKLSTPKLSLHKIQTNVIFMHIYFKKLSTNYTVQQFFDWVVGQSEDVYQSQPNRFELSGITVGLVNNSKSAVSDFEKSLKTPGSIVVYFGHTVLGQKNTLGLSPRDPALEKPDITCLRLTKLLNEAQAKIVVLAGCATSQCVTKTKGNTAVIVTQSGKDRLTNTLAWAPAIKSLLDELLNGSTVGDSLTTANKTFAKGSSTDSFKMIGGDPTLKL
jgi:hypothetical protein